MPTIISNTEFQKNPAKLAKSIVGKGAVVTIHGKPKMLVLPYFADSEEWLADYLEECEIATNRAKLSAELATSKASGKSRFSI